MLAFLLYYSLWLIHYFSPCGFLLVWEKKFSTEINPMTSSLDTLQPILSPCLPAAIFRYLVRVQVVVLTWSQFSKVKRKKNVWPHGCHLFPAPPAPTLPHSCFSCKLSEDTSRALQHLPHAWTVPRTSGRRARDDNHITGRSARGDNHFRGGQY